MLQRDAKSLSLQTMASNSPDLNPVDYSIWGILQDSVYRSRCEEVERRSAEGLEAAGPHHHRDSDCAVA